MKTTLLSLLFPLSLLTSTVEAGSIELVHPDALDMAREMGVNIAKFQAKFDEPVYATLGVTIWRAGQKEGSKMERTSSSPMKEHPFSLTIKDHDQIGTALGLMVAPDNAGSMSFSLFHPFAQFTMKDKHPFGPPIVGQSYATFVERQSMEAVELDKPLPLLIKAGPFDAKNPPPKDIRTNYHKAPGYYLLEVTFSKTKPAPEATPAKPDAATPGAEKK
jgi:hypothetical protein